MSLIKCPKCQNVVSDRASVCPHCGRKMKISLHSYCAECGAELGENDKVCKTCGFPVNNNMVHKRKKGGWKIVLLCCMLSIITSLSTCIGAALLFVNGVAKANGMGSIFSSDKKDILNFGSDEEKDESSKDKTATPDKTEFLPGEVAEYKNVQMSVLSHVLSSGNEFGSPTDGHVFVYVNIEITNNSEEEITVSSIASFDAYCDDYKLDYSSNALMAAADNMQQLDGNISPGKKLNGYLGLEVPSDWKTLEINYKDNVWLGSNFKFTITNN